MRICHVLYQYYPENPRPRRAAEAFSRLGHEVHVIAMRDEQEPPEEVISGVIVHRFPFPVIRGGRTRYLFQYLIFLFGSSIMLLRLHLKGHLDVVHVHSLPDFQVLSAAIEKASGTRLVLDLHEAMPELFAARFHLRITSWSVRVAKSVELICCLFADEVLVVNATMERRLVERGLDQGKIAIVMNSPEEESAMHTEIGKRRLGPTLGTHKAVVYVGGVNPERDMETLVRAVALLNDSQRPNLVIVGGGEARYKQSLRDLAHQVGLKDCLILGKVPPNEAFSYISLSDVGAITYERNPLTELAMPTKALEYAAARKPLVIADLPAIREIFKDAALYYRSGDPGDLATKIARLLADSPERAELVRRASEVLRACSWKLMLERLQRAYAGGVP